MVGIKKITDMKELTIEQVKANPQNFMYVFAADNFLAQLESKHATVIRGKRNNQKKLLSLSADRFGSTYEEYKKAVSDSFVSQFGMTVPEALKTLALGGEVAGKNWSDGVYGIGSQKSSTFNGAPGVSVDPDSGFMKAGDQLMLPTNTVFGNGGKAKIQVWQDKESGITYTSKLGKDGKWYAESYENSSTGLKYKANGKQCGNAESADVWASVLLDTGFFQKILDWILSLFNTNPEARKLTTENTLPSQTNDGFVYQSGFGTAGAIALLAVGAAVLANGGFGKKSKKSK